MAMASLFPELDPLPTAASFEQFWSAYPRKEGKKRAQRAFEKAIKKTTLETILHAIAWQSRKAQWRKVVNGVLEFVPHPTTWLNGERWNDPMPAALAPPPPPAPVDFEERARLIRLRAEIDHNNHLENVREIESGEIYSRYPNLPKGSVKPQPCPCFNCRRSRGDA